MAPPGKGLHLGILQTDHVHADLVGKHGDYPEMFRELFCAVDPSLTFTDYDVQQAPPVDIVCDAYIITGSKSSVYDDLPWIPPLVEFVRDVLGARKKIIGICFGHQLMAHFFGGRVAAADVGWAVGVHSSAVVQPRDWMNGELEPVRMLSSHRDQVLEPPPGAEVFLSSDFCPVGGYTIGSDVITVQAHPEFQRPYAEALMNMRRELIGEVVVEQGVDSLSKQTDELRVARWMLEFTQF